MSYTPVYTPYASFSTMSRTIGTNGGSWYIGNYIGTEILGDQTMGGATGLIQLRGQMEAQIIIPGDIAQDGDTVKKYVFLADLNHWFPSIDVRVRELTGFYCCIINSTLSYNACEVKRDGDSRTAGRVNTYTVPFCPMSKYRLAFSDNINSQLFSTILSHSNDHITYASILTHQLSASSSVRYHHGVGSTVYSKKYC